MDDLDETHELQISLKRYALSMEDKMAAGAFGHATNYGRDTPFKYPTKTSKTTVLMSSVSILQNCTCGT